jgi:hypothetical protein
MPALRPRERRAQAVVDAAAEREVLLKSDCVG